MRDLLFSISRKSDGTYEVDKPSFERDECVYLSSFFKKGSALVHLGKGPATACETWSREWLPGKPTLYIKATDATEEELR